MMEIPSPTAITLDITQGVAWVTLDQPPLNILTLETILELDRVLSTVAEQTWLKAAVLAANGTKFSPPVRRPKKFAPSMPSAFIASPVKFTDCWARMAPAKPPRCECLRRFSNLPPAPPR